MLSPLEAFTVPPDAETLLDHRSGILLQGADAVHLLDPANPAMAARLPLDPGEVLVDGLHQGILALQKGGTLLLLDYAENRRREWARLELPGSGTVVAVSPSGTAFAFAEAGIVTVHPLSATAALKSVRIDGTFSPGARFRLGEHFLAAADGGALTVWDTATAKVVHTVPIPTQGVGPLALSEEAGIAAAGGWFDEVFVADFKAGRTETVILPGRTFSLRFIPDAPSLLIAKSDAVHLWRPGAGTVAAFRAGGARFADARWTAQGVLALDTAGRRVHRLAYPGFPIRTAIPTGGNELWALAAPDDGAILFAGGSDGKLYAIDADRGSATPHELHTQGITALLCREDILASASDDKTIALWKLPSLQVFWRSQAHEYLINALFFSPSSRTLWSSSSDGKLKSWRWPQLAELEEITTGAGNHAALWVSDDESLILAGTWKRMLVVLEKSGGPWKAAQVFRLPCQSAYSMAPLPGVDAVLMIGTEPATMFLYDLRGRRLHRLPDLGLQTCWTLPIAPDTGIAAGSGGLLRCTVRRQGQAVRVSVALAVNPRVGTIGTACLLQGGRLALGTAAGEVLLTELAAIPFRDLATVALDDPMEPAMGETVLPFAPFP